MIEFKRLTADATEEERKLFCETVLRYADELDSHLERKTPRETLIRWANSMINVQGETDRRLEFCYSGGKPIGFLYGKIDREHHRGYKRVGDGYVMEFYVFPEFRCKGYGAEMYRHLEEAMISDGANGIYLTSDPVTGKPFWTAMGFRFTGEISPENDQEIAEKSLPSRDGKAKS